MLHAGLHRARAGEHLGDENECFAKLDADDAHSGNEAVVHDLQRIDALLERLAGQSIGGSVLALDNGDGQFLHHRPGLREQLDEAFDLLGPLEELLDLGADGFVRNVGETCHSLDLPRGRLVSVHAGPARVPVTHGPGNLEQVFKACL